MTKSMITITMALSILAVGTPLLAGAQPTANPGVTPGAPSAAAPAADMVSGEVRSVNKDTKKITLKHAEMPSLEMPPMTMVFQVKDPAMLDMVKSGDKVRFKAQKAGGAFVVTELEVVR